MNSKLLKIAVTITGIFFIGSALGQNYRYFDPERVRTYGIEGEHYFFVDIQSTEIDGTDTTYYFKQRIDTTTLDCEAKTNAIDIIGPKVTIRADSVVLFFNKDLDTIKIYPSKASGIPWVAYTYPDGSYITATFVNYAYGLIMPGIYDSIKVIRYNVYDPDDNIQTDSLINNWNFDIGKQFGLFEFISFANFPYDTINYKLRGLSDPNEGLIFDVNVRNAFNYLLGGEFHYREEAVPDIESGSDKRISAWKYFVMEKTLTESAAIYTMERIRFDTLINDDITSSSFIWDTIELTFNYTDYSFLDSIELTLLEQTRFGYSDWIKEDTLFADIAHKYIYDWYEFDEPANCLTNPENITQPEQLYGDGLGLMHYMDSTDAENYYKLDLVYFQKGLLTWGTPYDFSDLDLANEDLVPKQFNIFPNPASNALYITSSEGMISEYEIISVDGKVMLSGELNSISVTVDIFQMPAGFYTIIMHTETGMETHTFVKLRD